MNLDATSACLTSIRDYCEQKLAKDVIGIDQSDTIPEHVFADLVALRLFAFASLSDNGQELAVQERTELLFRFRTRFLHLQTCTAARSPRRPCLTQRPRKR